VTGPCLGLNVPATNLQENEVVFGGLERLKEEILNCFEIMEGSIYFVLTGCLPEVIGDDVESLVLELNSPKRPVLFSSVPGFNGDSYKGYEEALKTIFLGLAAKKTSKNSSLVNVLGVPPAMDPFWRGNLEGIESLLSLLGLKSNLFFGPRADLELIKKSGSAAKNIVVSPLYGLEAAELALALYGLDYVQAPLPIGAAASERFLRIVGQALKIPSTKVEAAISEASRIHYLYLEPIIDLYNDMELQRHALVVGDVNYALALSDFLIEDLGWASELVAVVNDLTESQKEAVLDFRKRLGGPYSPEKLIFENRAEAIRQEAFKIWKSDEGKKYRNDRKPIFVAGSSLERTLAAQLGAAHLSLTFPVTNRAVLTTGYTGYLGGLRLTEDLVDACVSGR
jgi:nitrogenase molybdenum-iron protein beta chain